MKAAPFVAAAGLVDGSGRLWVPSEPGTCKYMAWPTHCPLIFRIEAGRLR